MAIDREPRPSDFDRLRMLDAAHEQQRLNESGCGGARVSGTQWLSRQVLEFKLQLTGSFEMFADMMRLQMQTARMLIEAQAVIGMRMLGIAGVLSTSPSENLRMITEKQAAFAEASMAATRAAMTGKTSAQTYGAALRPVARRTRANSRRLSRRKTR